jgi:hypothetical protein
MKLLPVTVKRNPGLPASTAAGLKVPRDGEGFDVAVIVNFALPELPPPGPGVVMLMFAVPATATSAVLICACIWVSDVNVVGRALPFHCTIEDDRKFCPVMVNVNPWAPAFTDPGMIEVIAAVGFEAGGGGGGLLTGVVVPPPHDKRRVRKHSTARDPKVDKTRREGSDINRVSVACIKEQLTLEVNEKPGESLSLNRLRPASLKGFGTGKHRRIQRAPGRNKLITSDGARGSLRVCWHFSHRTTIRKCSKIPNGTILGVELSGGTNIVTSIDNLH